MSGASPITRGLAKEIIGTKRPRQRVLNDDELTKFWEATAKAAPPFGHFARMLLVTGQRLREVAEAEVITNSISTRRFGRSPSDRMKGELRA